MKQNFSTYETWMLLRESKTQCNWARGVCFSQATLKFAFMAWLSIRDRMSTLDRVARWSQGLDDMCVLCKNAPESRTIFSSSVPILLRFGSTSPKGYCKTPSLIFGMKILILIRDEIREKKSLFCVKYAFQAVLYAVWRERNKIKHGDKLLPLPVLKRTIDKWIRNKISLMRMKGIKGMEELMQFWFHTIM